MAGGARRLDFPQEVSWRWEFFSLGLLFELHVLYALATAYYFARRDPYKSYVFNSLVEMTLQFSCLRAQEVHINEHFVDLHLNKMSLLAQAHVSEQCANGV